MISNPVLDRQRLKVRELERALVIERAKLDGMEEMAQSMSPPALEERQTDAQSVPEIQANSVRYTDANAVRGAGKQPGQLSMDWRGVLQGFYKGNYWFSDSEAAHVYERNTGKRLSRPGDVKRRLEGYANHHGFVEIGTDGRFRVTDVAAERFGFQRATINEAAGYSVDG
ncbi:MAG: hypothetical protein RL490_862 [Pseudomonadota bacterium]|jgi:hypothetical protein